MSTDQNSSHRNTSTRLMTWKIKSVIFSMLLVVAAALFVLSCINAANSQPGWITYFIIGFGLYGIALLMRGYMLKQAKHLSEEHRYFRQLVDIHQTLNRR